MCGLPAQPAPVRTEVFINGGYIRAGGLADEGGVNEAEVKIGLEQGAKDTGLGMEDTGIGAAAMKTKEAGERKR